MIDASLTNLDTSVGEEVKLTIEEEIRPISRNIIQLNAEIRKEAIKMKAILMKYEVINLQYLSEHTYEEMKEDKAFIERITNLLCLGLSQDLNVADFGFGLVCELDLVVNMRGKNFEGICRDLHIDHVPTRDTLKKNQRKLRYKISVLAGLIIFNFDFAETPPTAKAPKVLFVLYFFFFFCLITYIFIFGHLANFEENERRPAHCCSEKKDW